MIDWWGPVLSESYGGTESGTVCSINSTDWLAHPGSVGRAVAAVRRSRRRRRRQRAVAEHRGPAVLPRHHRPRHPLRRRHDKTADAHLAPGVFTLGEMGYVDEDGFVYITDRFSDMVVSGGVNIYPAEAEQVLALHPDVADVACVGVPDDEMGERLVALVELRRGRTRRTSVRRLRVVPRIAGRIQVPEGDSLRGRDPAQPDGQDRQAIAAATASAENLEADYSKGRSAPWVATNSRGRT